MNKTACKKDVNSENTNTLEFFMAKRWLPAVFHIFSKVEIFARLASLFLGTFALTHGFISTVLISAVYFSMMWGKTEKFYISR